MADTVYIQNASSKTLYYQIWDSGALVYNGSSFEAYDPARWSFYDNALTEKGASGIYTAAFPALSAGHYVGFAFDQGGGSPAEGDVAAGVLDVQWDGSALIDISDLKTHGDATWATVTAGVVGGAVLTNSANKLTCNGSGEVVASNMVGTAGANTTTPPTAAAIATAVTADIDANSAKLTAIVADTNELQTDWKDGGRLDLLLDAIKTETDDLKNDARLDLIFDAIKVVTDKLESALEADGPNWRFTTNALVNGPNNGDATAANQSTIITNIAALNNITANQARDAILNATIDGTLDFQTAMKRIASMAGGKMVRTSSDPFTYQMLAEDNVTVLYTLATETDGSVRTRS